MRPSVAALCVPVGAVFVLAACGDSDSADGNLHRPTVSAVESQTTVEDTPLSGIAFSVADIESAPDALAITATSGNQAIVANAGLTVEGTGANRTLSIEPVENATGRVRITIFAADPDFAGESSFFLDVTPVNDAPAIAGQAGVARTNEDTDFEIVTGSLSIDDPDDTSFTVSVGSGDNYTVLGATVTPAANFNGSLTIPVTVSDGELDSNTIDFTLAVTAVNDPPVVDAVVGGPFETSEDTPFAFDLSDFTVSDVDSDVPGDLSVVVLAGDDYTPDGDGLVPAADFNGPLTVNVAVSDGADESASTVVTVVVNPVNDPPVVTGQETLIFPEDLPFSIGVDDLTIVDPDSPPEALTVLPQPGANYTVDGTSITPTRDFIGVLTIPVIVNDGSADSAPFNVAVTITEGNIPPVAGDDSYVGVDGTTGNVELEVSAGDGLLDNDSDGDGPQALAAVEVTGGATANGGEVDIAADGSFVYRPPVGFLGTDSFSYSATDGQDTDTATATVFVASPMAWFVDNRVGPSGDGRSHAPFDELKDVEAVVPVTASDEIRVSAGTGLSEADIHFRSV